MPRFEGADIKLPFLITAFLWLLCHNGWATPAPSLTAQVAVSDVLLPSADIAVTEPLSSPWKHGFRMEGATAAWGHKLNSSMRGATTLLYSRIEGDGPLFTYTGSGGLFSKFCLSGKYLETEPTPDDLVLWSMRFGGKGMGTGKVSLHNMGFAYAGCGIEIGDGPWMKNCDNLVATGFTRFLHCKTGLRVRNHMGMHQRFDTVEARECDTIFEYFAGGDLKVSSVFIVGATTALSIRNPGPGENNGLFEINDLKTDQQSGSGAKLMTVELPAEGQHPSRGRATFNGGLIAYDDYTRDGALLADINSAWVLTVRDYENLQGQTFKLTGVQHKGRWFKPTLIVENCTLENGVTFAQDLIHPDSTNYHVSITNCRDSRGNRIPDFEGP